MDTQMLLENKRVHRPQWGKVKWNLKITNCACIRRLSAEFFLSTWMLSVSGCDPPGWVYGGGDNDWIAEVCHQNNQPKLLQGATPVLVTWRLPHSQALLQLFSLSVGKRLHSFTSPRIQTWARGLASYPDMGTRTSLASRHGHED